jgi:hypothetical protein
MIFAVLAATGAPWLALQSVAWTAMLAENLHSTSWEQAVERTFDGKHPCCLCKQIAAARKSEKKSDAQVEVKKLDYSYTNFEFAFCPPSQFYETGGAFNSPVSLTYQPPVPPPKALLG